MLNLNYDNRYDILYVGISDKKNSIGDEEYDGLLVLRDIQSNNITGLTIFDFFERYKTNRLPAFPLEVKQNVRREIDSFVGK